MALLPAGPLISAGIKNGQCRSAFWVRKKWVNRLPVNSAQTAQLNRVIHRVSGGVEGCTHVRDCEFQYGFDERVFRMVW
jgi:hypothetical protein